MNDALHTGLPPVLNVDNLANGAVYELLGRELARLAENIDDPNTSATSKRKIKIEIVATPYPDRSGATYTVSVASTLAGTKPAEGNLYIVRRGTELLVVGKNHKQMEMELGAVAISPAEAARRPS